jgi:arginine exporter protein ArgO
VLQYGIERKKVMNLKVRALLYSLGVLAASAVAGLAAVEIVKMINISLLPWIGVGFLLIMSLYVLYNITLTQLEYREKLNEIVEKK